MQTVVLIVHVFISLMLIALILMQQGKGADAGASMGNSASQSIFGSQGSGNFLTKLTTTLMTLFFMSSLSLGYLMAKSTKLKNLDELLKQVPVQTNSNPLLDSKAAKDKIEQDDIPTNALSLPAKSSLSKQNKSQDKQDRMNKVDQQVNSPKQANTQKDLTKPAKAPKIKQKQSAKRSGSTAKKVK